MKNVIMRTLQDLEGRGTILCGHKAKFVMALGMDPSLVDYRMPHREATTLLGIDFKFVDGLPIDVAIVLDEDKVLVAAFQLPRMIEKEIKGRKLD